jgi:PAS domain S-box-containing protein
MRDDGRSKGGTRPQGGPSTAARTDPGFAQALGSNDAFAGFSRLSIALILTDPRQPDNPIVYINDAFERTTGYKREAVIGRNCRFLQGEGTDKRDVDRLREAIAAGRDVSVDIVNYRANGSRFINRLIIAPILDDAGQPLFFLGMQKELVESDRAGDHRISTEHLRQMQALMQRDLGLILEGLREPDADTPPGQGVEALARRLETLQYVYEELRVGRKTRGKPLLDLGVLLGRIASAISHDAGRAGLRFEQAIEACDVGLEAATRISLIISEALQNAHVHAFAGMDEGRLELRVTRLTGGGLRIIVSDDGVGLPPGTEWPGNRTAGGRLVRKLMMGLDATLNVARGAAGTVVVIDVPVDLDL